MKKKLIQECQLEQVNPDQLIEGRRQLWRARAAGILGELYQERGLQGLRLHTAVRVCRAGTPLSELSYRYPTPSRSHFFSMQPDMLRTRAMPKVTHSKFTYFLPSMTFDVLHALPLPVPSYALLPTLLTNHCLFDRAAKAYTEKLRSSILTAVRCPTAVDGRGGGGSPWRFSVVRRGPSRRGEPQFAAVIASDRSNRGTAIEGQRIIVV